MRRKFWEFGLHIRLYFKTLLKKFRHTPSDKKQNKTTVTTTTTTTNRNRQIDKQGCMSMSKISRRSSKEGKKMSFWFLSLNFTSRRQFISAQQSLMECTSSTWSFALFNKSHLDLVRSSSILTPLFNLFLAL